MEFCEKYQCVDCCLEPKVQLLNEDINRIVYYGYYDAFFVDEAEGVKTLRKRDDGTCVFYNKVTGQCDIYISRPERCRLNPYTISKY